MPEDARQQALFQELILDHYRRPRNRRALDGADRRVSLRNPLCGDDVTVYLALDGDRVREATFTGQGCSITQAAASMLTSAVAGRSLGEVRALLDGFGRMIAGEARDDVAGLGELGALAGVARHPGRRRCALLPADAVAAALVAPDVSDAASDAESGASRPE